MPGFGRGKGFPLYQSQFSFFPSMLKQSFVKWKPDYLTWLQGSTGLTSLFSSVTQSLRNASQKKQLCPLFMLHFLHLLKPHKASRERLIFSSSYLCWFWWLAAIQKEQFNKYPKICPFFRREQGAGMDFLFLVLLADLAWSDTEQKQWRYIALVFNKSLNTY